ncbi:hypothetical protein E2C01_071871 [Portunus trituberculatus]|uniref:Uncharacterized protein n=1 Tax=Portunus trituberculatus TaxID=210409 RepID=A0A5B7I948_PORTR|nr:hypothetical protein [Portunus trituberculatus]
MKATKLQGLKYNKKGKYEVKKLRLPKTFEDIGRECNLLRNSTLILVVQAQSTAGERSAPETQALHGT